VRDRGVGNGDLRSAELGHLAATTRDDRKKILRDDGPLISRFGAFKLDAIRRRDLISWWEDFIKGEGRRRPKRATDSWTPERSPRTGKNYLDALSSVFVWAMEREIVEENPVESLRAILRRRNRTERGRAESEEAAERACPIERPDDVAAIVEAARGEGAARSCARCCVSTRGSGSARRRRSTGRTCSGTGARSTCGAACRPGSTWGPRSRGARARSRCRAG